MCGRYTLTIDKSTIEHHFGAKFYIAQASYDWSPTYNAAPSQMLPIMRTHKPDTIELARWGFWPEEWKRIALDGLPRPTLVEHEIIECHHIPLVAL